MQAGKVAAAAAASPQNVAADPSDVGGNGLRSTAEQVRRPSTEERRATLYFSAPSLPISLRCRTRPLLEQRCPNKSVVAHVSLPPPPPPPYFSSYLDLQHLVHRRGAPRQPPEAVHRRGEVALERSLDADVFLRDEKKRETKAGIGSARLPQDGDGGWTGLWRRHAPWKQAGNNTKPAWLAGRPRQHRPTGAGMPSMHLGRRGMTPYETAASESKKAIRVYTERTPL